MSSTSETISLIGAGLNGPLLAIGLVQRGFHVTIYERRPDMRRVEMRAGRSINLALSTRGIHALNKVGLWDAMREISLPMRGRMMHAVNGELTFQRYGKDDSESINSISRADLNIALMNAAETKGVEIRFEMRCTGFDCKTGAVHLRDERSGGTATVDAGVVIGCDGSASAIRNSMIESSGFSLSQQQLDYGYKELTIPAKANGKHALEPHALHIWPRGNYMLIALPNVDGSFACILFLPFEGAESFANLTSADHVNQFFRAHFPDAPPLMPQLAENYFTNPTGTMVTVKCWPWHVGATTLLLGDAAHAIVPFFGQGLNCGFEDCTCLLDLIDQHGADWPRVFAEFETSRKSNTDAIADMAVDNFVEMRNRVADPRFLFRKKIELALEAKYPDLFVPKYAMVTFHRIPYAVAAARGAVQEQILSVLGDSIDRVEDLDWNEADRLIRAELAPLVEA